MAHTAHKSQEMMEEVHEGREVVADKAKQLADLIRQSKHVVVFTGAGISTSAGIPDYRGPQGAWTLAAKGEKRTNPTTDMVKAIPTPTHMALVALYQAGHVHHVISQNVDGLHRKSGIPFDSMSELHGNSNLEQCEQCNEAYFRDFNVFSGREDHNTGRRCQRVGCNGLLKDTIINFGENLSQVQLQSGFSNSEKADLHICLGSSLTVSPACDMPKATKSAGGKLVIANLQRTPLDSLADLRLHCPVDELLGRVMAELQLEIPPFVLHRHVAFRIGTPVKDVKSSQARESEDLELSVTGIDVSSGCLYSLFDTIFVKVGDHAEQRGTYEVIPARFVVPRSAARNKDLAVGLTANFFGHYGEPQWSWTWMPYADGNPSEESAADVSVRVDLSLPLQHGVEPNWHIDAVAKTETFHDSSFTAPLRGELSEREQRAAHEEAHREAAGANRKANGDRHDLLANKASWFAVTPLPSCEHCTGLRLRDQMTVDVGAPCTVDGCNNVGENMFCLSCGVVCCGRHVNGHMLDHHEATKHPIVCGFADLSFWCYECDAYILESNANIRPFYEVLCASKFSDEC